MQYDLIFGKIVSQFRSDFMIKELYTQIKNKYNNREYVEVVKLVNQALCIPDFGFDRTIMYIYAYSLLMMQKEKEAMRVFEIIQKFDPNSNMLEMVSSTIQEWKRQQEIKMNAKEFYEGGNQLEEGLVVYIKGLSGFQSNVPPTKIAMKFPYLIWKIEGSRVFAFPLPPYKNHGYQISGFKYFKEIDRAAKPNLVSFDKKSISYISLKLDKKDYYQVLKDLYERFCIFGSLDSSPKNDFVLEMRKNLSIQAEDVICLFDASTREKKYYYLTHTDYEREVYLGAEITHVNGEIGLKSGVITEIPFSSFILEKANISLDNKKRLANALSTFGEDNQESIHR